MSEPTQTCTTCGDVEVVRHDGRGFPPDIAKRRLAKRCKAAGHTCTPTYRAGLSRDLARAIARSFPPPVSGSAGAAQDKGADSE